MSSSKLIDSKNSSISFSFLERLHAYLQEQSHQLKVLKRLSPFERRRLFEEFSQEKILQITRYLSRERQGADRMTVRVLDRVLDFGLRLCLEMEQEREEQVKLGILGQGAQICERQIKAWKLELANELKKIHLPEGIRQRLTLKLLTLPPGEMDNEGLEDHSNPKVPVVFGNETNNGFSLENLFFEIHGGGARNQDAFLRFLKEDFRQSIPFLEHKLKDGEYDEQELALELAACMVDRAAILFVSRACYHKTGEIGQRAIQILTNLEKSPSFKKFHRLIGFFLDQVRKRDQQLRHRKAKETQLLNEKNEKDSILQTLSSKDPMECKSLILSLDQQKFLGYHKEIQELYENSSDLLLKSMILKKVAAFRARELYDCYESALKSRDEKLIYHALLHCRDFALFEFCPKIERNLEYFNAFNQILAKQILQCREDLGAA